MKIAPLLCLGTMLVTLAAFAQEPVVVCIRSADGSCVWVNQDDAPQAYPAPAPPSPPRDEDDLNRADMESEVWFDWAPASLEQDPLLGKPGMCARTPGRARYRFAVGMHSNDINKIIEAYDWRGKTSAEAEALVTRLDAIPRTGGWERSVVTGWAGEDPGPVANDHWRWAASDQVFYFSTRNVDGCWFVHFGSDPGNTAIVRRARPIDQQKSSEPVMEEPGVYNF